MKLQLLKLEENNIKKEHIEDVCDFFNYHRKLTKAPKALWETMEEAEETLQYWIKEGEFHLIQYNDETVGFLYYQYINKTFVRIEDIYIREKYRKQGIGKKTIQLLDTLLKNNGVISCSVNVIPRNKSAMEFYISCGFDHLNMIEIRKNYDKSFDKSDEIKLLGYTLKKY